jgi:NADH-quinone oxidoreductase subunit A
MSPPFLLPFFGEARGITALFIMGNLPEAALSAPSLLNTYIPVLVMAGVAILLAGVLIGLSHILGPKRPTPQKLAPYECGVTPIGSARERFPIKFYLIAMLFIIFDIETVFLYPWAVTYRHSGSMILFNLVEMLVFVIILFVGYYYVWKRGAFEWDS